MCYCILPYIVRVILVYKVYSIAQRIENKVLYWCIERTNFSVVVIISEIPAVYISVML